jgi:hypothetical protein
MVCIYEAKIETSPWLMYMRRVRQLIASVHASAMGLKYRGGGVPRCSTGICHQDPNLKHLLFCMPFEEISWSEGAKENTMGGCVIGEAYHRIFLFWRRRFYMSNMDTSNFKRVRVNDVLRNIWFNHGHQLYL